MQAPVYQGGTFFIVTGMAILLFGLDAVAREIQDPFGFDDNDLNVQGYELTLMRVNHDAFADIRGRHVYGGACSWQSRADGVAGARGWL
jgi:hypothetical protein